MGSRARLPHSAIPTGMENVAQSEASTVDLTSSLLDELQTLSAAPSSGELNGIADALTTLENTLPDEHWWHEQQQEGAILLGLFAHADTCRNVGDLATKLLDPVGRCPHCAVAYHQAKVPAFLVPRVNCANLASNSSASHCI